MSALDILLLVSVYATSMLSGMFGMAGGMILMGIYATVLPVTAAMVLHGFTQASANGLRWYMLRQHTAWHGIRYYALGATLSIGAVYALAFVPDKTVIFLFLGIIPLAGALLPPTGTFDFSRRSGAFVCGVLVTGVQLMAGVAGSLLDLFFVKSPYRREEVVATKALTQLLSHLLKLAYFAQITLKGSDSFRFPWWFFLATFVMAYLGTATGARILAAMSERRFRQVSQVLVLGIGLVYLARGVSAWLVGR